MKRILCFGDSNTWGFIPSGCAFDPKSAKRHADDTRWTGVLQKLLGSGWLIIEEGHNGRTTVLDDPVSPGRNAKTYIYPCLESQKPLDLVIIMLGSNDLKTRFSFGAQDAAQGVGELVKLVRSANCGLCGDCPAILVISPILVGEQIERSPYGNVMGGMSAVFRSREFSKYYKDIAKATGCHFLDAAKHAGASDADSLHMDEENHAKLARAVCAKVKEILG